MAEENGSSNKKSSGADSGGSSEHSSKQALDRASKANASDVLTPEVVEVIRQEKSQIDVNILLVQIVNKSEDPNEIIEKSKQILELTQQYEEQRLKSFKERADAIIDIRTRDPDEIEKRKNNSVRRTLKLVLGASIIIGGTGTVVALIREANILLAGILAVITGLGIAVSAPLAAGESVSSNDVVRIFGAVKGLFGVPSQQVPPTKSQKGKR